MSEIKATLVTKQELQRKILKTLAIANPQPSDATKQKGSWMQGTVKNCTQFPLQVRPPPYFYSGRYETWPSEIPAWSVGQFTVVNSDNSPAGVTGGNAWDLHLQQGIDVNIAFGFTCPVVGPYTSAVIESATAKDGYDNSTDGGNKIISKNQFFGQDNDGGDTTIMFEVQCSGGQRPVYTITQAVY